MRLAGLNYMVTTKRTTKRTTIMIDKNIPLNNKVLDDVEIFLKEGFDEKEAHEMNSIFSMRSLKIMMAEQDD